MAQKTIKHSQVDAGLGPHQLVKLQADGKLPPLDGSNLTNVPGTGELINDTSPQLGGNLDLNTFSLFTTDVGSPGVASADNFTFVGGSNSATAGSLYGGGVNFTGGAATNGNYGGRINLTGGSASGSGYGGYVYLQGGNGLAGAGGGTVYLYGGTSTGSTLSGGDIRINSGDNTAASDAANGGIIDLSAGNSTTSTSGIGGDISLYAGAGGATGGNVRLQAGTATNGTGGSIIIEPGPATTGTDGTVDLASAASGITPVLRFFEDSANGSNYVALQAPSNFVTSRTWVLPQDDPAALGTGSPHGSYFLTTDASGNLSFAFASGGGGATALNDLTDVSVAGSPTTGHVLTYNGSVWTDSAGVGLFSEDAQFNIVGGTGAGTSLLASGTNNFIAGRNAGDSITTGDFNVCIGDNAGGTITTTTRNVAIGPYAMHRTDANVAGDNNVAIGSNAGRTIRGTTSDYNTFVGANAGNSIVTGGGIVSNNTVIGGSAMTKVTAGGSHNVAAGKFAITNCTTGSSNVGIGSSALRVLGTGDYNVAVGYRAGYWLSAASTDNVIIGHNAGPTSSTELNNQLIISNSAGLTPLIGGDFSTNDVTINGTLTVTGAVYAGSPSAKLGGGITAVVEDTTPQLGGDLDTNNFDIISTDGSAPTNIDITGGTKTSGTSGTVGNINLTAGDMSAATSSLALTAGTVTVTAGDNLRTSGGTSGGAVNLTAGNASTSTSGTGGSVNIAAGDGGNVGGNIILTPGVDSTDGSINGTVQIKSGGAAGTVTALRIYEGVNYIGLTVPTTLGSDVTWTLPDDDPNTVAGYFLTTDASGNLSFAPAGAGGSPASGFVSRAGDTMVGDLTMSGSQIFLDDGAVGNPAIAFTSDTNTGIFYSAGNMNLVYNGAVKASIGTSGITMSSGEQFLADKATVGAPGFSFVGAVNTGWWCETSPPPTKLRAAVGGATYLDITAAGIQVTGSGTFTGGVDKLTTATGVVDVSAATAPSVGQVLTATSGTAATWQDATGATVLNNLTDVSVAGSPAVYGQVLTYVAGSPPYWTNQAPAAAGDPAMQITYTFDTSTASGDPGSGNIRFSTSSPITTTALYVNDTPGEGFDTSRFWGDVTRGDQIYIKQLNDDTKYLFGRVDDDPTDGTGWWTVPISVGSGYGGTLPDNGATVGIMKITGKSLGVDSNGNFVAGTGNSPGANNNIVIGNSAGSQLSTSLATENVVIGQNAGRVISSSDRNVAIGKEAMGASSGTVGGYNNVAIGRRAAYNISGTPNGNVAIGHHAGRREAGSFNTFIGVYTGNQSTAMTGSQGNIGIGQRAAGGITSGDFNTCIGLYAGSNITTGTDNVCIGRRAGPTTNVSQQLFIDYNASGFSDTPLIHGDFSTDIVTINGDLTVTGTLSGGGTSALNDLSNVTVDGGSPAIDGHVLTYNDATGQWINQEPAGGVLTENGTSIYGGTGSAKGGTNNLVIGYNAGSDLQASATDNICIGRDAGRAIYSGDRNIFMGAYAGGNAAGNMGAGNNIGFGFKALEDMTGNGYGNIAMGEYTGRNVTTGKQNIFIGGRIGFSAATTTGTNNVIIGAQACYSISTGTNNVIIGRNAGSGITSGGYNVLLGHQAGSGSGNFSNQLFIDNSNTTTPLIHGDFSTDDVTINGNLTVTGTATGDFGGGGKPQYEQIIIGGSPASTPSPVINTTVPTVGIAGSPLLASLQVFRNGILQDEDLDAGSPATISEDYKVTGPNQITFADGLLTVGGKIKIFAFT